jgi:FKBP-type peptidyl-prolyl cis-trans isomerase 2
VNAVIKQKREQDKVLQNHGLASLIFTLHWSDGRAAHEEEMHVENFSVFREADFLPPEIGTRLVGMRAGDSAQATLPAGEVTGAWDGVREVSGSTSRFDRSYLRGIEVEPRYGRFYPQGIFHGLEGIVREALEPARITALDEQTMRVDLNHPLARYPFKVVCQVDQVLPGSDRRGGRCSSPLDDLLRYPGLAAPVQDGLDTSFGDDGHGLARMDEREDKLFYSNSRFVHHLAARWRAHHFFRNTSRVTSCSSNASANSFLRRAFSVSNAFNRLASDTSIPPNLLRQR